MTPAAYAATGEALVDRILALIPAHPEILTMDSPWKLFHVDGFTCRDLEPSFAQADCALSKAQQIARAKAEGRS